MRWSPVKRRMLARTRAFRPPAVEIARVTEIAKQLVGESRICAASRRFRRSHIVNWDVLPLESAGHFTVFEKTVAELQDAMTKGVTTSEDITREYLGASDALRSHTARRSDRCCRSTRSDRRCPRARCRARAAARARGPFHGVPIVFKDNIDAIELPTTSGSLALLDHRPRLDSRVAAGMKRGGAVVLGKANLDEFPVRRFRHQHGRRHRRQRLRSVAQHLGLERRQRHCGRGQPGGARLRHRHLQLAVESRPALRRSPPFARRAASRAAPA